MNVHTFKAHVPVGPETDYPNGPYEGDEYYDRFDREWWRIPMIETVDAETGEKESRRTWPTDSKCRRAVIVSGNYGLCRVGDRVPPGKSYSALSGFDSSGKPLWAPIMVSVQDHFALVLLRYARVTASGDGTDTAELADGNMSRIQRNAFGLPGSPSPVEPATRQPNVVTMAPINFTGESKA